MKLSKNANSRRHDPLKYILFLYDELTTFFPIPQPTVCDGADVSTVRTGDDVTTAVVTTATTTTTTVIDGGDSSASGDEVGTADDETFEDTRPPSAGDMTPTTASPPQLSKPNTPLKQQGLLGKFDGQLQVRGT